MKKSRIIIPALGLIALGTAASITGTVAWFSMNNTVTANGMQVAVKSNSTFLLIGTSATASDIQTAGTTTTALTVTALESQVLPSAHDTITNTATATSTTVSNLHHYKKTADDSTITIDQYNALSPAEKTAYEAVNQNGTNWYYQIADAVDDSESTKQKNYLATLDTAYIIHKVCYVTIAQGANNATNLIVSKATWTNQGAGSIDAATCLVTSATAAVEMSPTSVPAATVLAAEVTAAATVQLDVFIYYDGNHDDVYTNNRANLSGATLELEFSATAAA